MLGALRSYLQLASGLTDVTRQRAVTAARQLLDQGGEVVDLAVSQTVGAGVGRQVQSLAEDLIATSKTNRDLLIGLIRTEIERAVARLGLVGADELATVSQLVGRLQSQLDAAIAFGGRQDSAEPTPGAAHSTVKKAPAKKVAVKKAPAKKVAVKKVPAKKVAVKKAPAKKVPVKKVAVAATPVDQAVRSDPAAPRERAATAAEPVAPTELTVPVEAIVLDDPQVVQLPATESAGADQ